MHVKIRRHLESILKPGDRVAVSGKNTAEWIIVFVATVWSGFVGVPMNSWWTPKEMEYALNDCGASLLYADEERMKRLRQIDPKLLPKLRQSVALETLFPPAFRLTAPEELEYANRAKTKEGRSKINPESCAVIMYTSGTTGHPKGVVLCHRGMAHAINVYNLIQILGDAKRSKEAQQQRKSILLTVPLFHATGMHAILLPSFLTARKIVMMGKWNAEKALELIERERVTQFTGVPTMILELLSSKDLKTRDVSSLQNIGGGGAAIPGGFSRPRSSRFGRPY